MPTIIRKRGNSPFRGIVFCNFVTPKTVISKIVPWPTLRSGKVVWKEICHFGVLSFAI